MKITRYNNKTIINDKTSPIIRIPKASLSFLGKINAISKRPADKTPSIPT